MERLTWDDIEALADANWHRRDAQGTMLNKVRAQFHAYTVELADAQATVKALQRERDEAIEAASLPTWVCDGCGRVSSDGWINRVTEFLDGTDYEMECPTCGVRDIEEDCASDLVRERDDLQDALDAEREKVKGLHEVTKVICAHCCEPMEIPSKAVLQTQLTQLQALVRAFVDHFDGDFENPGLELYGQVNGKEIANGGKALNDLLDKARATLDATPPAQTDEQRFIEACCERPDDCKWGGGSGGCGYEGRKPKGGDDE